MQDATKFFMFQSMRHAILQNIDSGRTTEVAITLQDGSKAVYCFDDEGPSVYMIGLDDSGGIRSDVEDEDTDASPGIFESAFSHHLKRMEAAAPPPLDLNPTRESAVPTPESAVRYCAGPCGQELSADHRHVRCQACNNDWYLRNSGNCTPCKEDGCGYMTQKGMPLCRSCFSGRRQSGWCVKPNCQTKVTGGHKLCRECYIDDPRTQERHGAMLKADVDRASLRQENERARRQNTRN